MHTAPPFTALEWLAPRYLLAGQLAHGVYYDPETCDYAIVAAGMVIGYAASSAAGWERLADHAQRTH